MIGRISFYQTHGDIRKNILDMNKEVNKLSNQLSTQEKIQELRENPMDAALGSRYSSAISRKESYVENNREVYDNMQLAEGYVKQSVDILQRSREIAVQTATGTLSTEDRGYMGAELNELIEAMADMVNSKDGKGNYIFGGARTNIPPFRILRTVTNQNHKKNISAVEYVGSNRANQIPISEHDTIKAAFPGNEIFWTKKTNIVGNSEVLNYVVPDDSTIIIDNVKINLSRGDSLQSVVAKINKASVDMNAKINSFTGKLELLGTDNKEIWISDGTGQVMQDLGIINGINKPPLNISGEASIFEENLFDTLIELRDSMYDSDYTAIGGKVLANIDKGMNTVFSSLAKIGAVSNRLDVTYERLERRDIPALTQQLDEAVAVDMAETISKWQELLQAQQASYKVSTQVMQTSLLDYI